MDEALELLEPRRRAPGAAQVPALHAAAGTGRDVQLMGVLPLTSPAQTITTLRAFVRGVVARHRVRRQARAHLRGRAVILDVETTDLDGSICQIAVIDTRGRTLLATLVDPCTPCAPEATSVHGLRDVDLAGAPTWPQVWPAVQKVLDGAAILAYNSAFDRARLAADCARWGLATDGADDPARWWCVMRARATLEGGPWRRLGASHDALDDVRATLNVLRALAA